MKRHHFVLVHGACHGAWSWYKLKHRLESAGHRVTALDLTASGTNTRSIHDVHTFCEYTEPLLELLASLGAQERVILVGHSLGGLNLALAADRFPKKISVTVFLAAFMPDTAHRPSYVLEEYSARAPERAWLDTQFAPIGKPDKPFTSMFFGPDFLSSKLYQLCPTEDLELGKILTRPGSLFIEDLSTASNFTREGYGSTMRVYVVCRQDLGIPLKFQQWMIANGGAHHVLELDGADHMAMLSKPQELCDCLLEMGPNTHLPNIRYGVVGGFCPVRPFVVWFSSDCCVWFVFVFMLSGRFRASTMYPEGRWRAIVSLLVCKSRSAL